MTSNLAPGLLAIHSDRMEHLRDTVFGWLRANPLRPLEQETFLVQSNGVAEWLKVSMAEQMGVCSGVQVTLPARFLWRVYRQVLGPQGVPRRSPYDRLPLTWRLMQLLPALIDEPAFAPLAYFLKDNSAERRLQLAEKLADLFDQYQVYRANWLSAWASGDEVLIDARGQRHALAPDQIWQPRLWRALRVACADDIRDSGRADVHRQFVEALKRPELAIALPRRVVLFGVASLPYQTLEALGALARHVQVIVAAPNPCQYYWGDIISGRELLTAQRRHQRYSPRSGNLAEVPFEQMHAHCHPLLAGWGRLGRDFIRMLDEFDDVHATRRDFPTLRVDVFSEGEGDTLLAQVQAAIRDMQPLPGDADQRPRYDARDSSIRFHIAHSAQREVEILHDQLLEMLASRQTSADGDNEDQAALQPRDIIVMVPDIEKFAPAVRAVFGQYPRGDKRHVPFQIADVSARRTNPMLIALEWLLHLPRQRCLQSEVRDLLDVPAIAARIGIAQHDLPQVAQWVEAAGVRWGLDAGHREALALASAGEQNAWLFGMRRMLLGYANGANDDYAGIEPLAQVGGLDAALAGSLAHLVDCLTTWRRELATPRTPAEWGAVAEGLQRAFFKPVDEDDQLTLAQLNASLQTWLQDCADAGFADPLPAAVLAEAWLGPLDEKTLHQRFISGGVTFCTLMPMRALPYRVVCLLGMNDGDFPRRGERADFDLLALPGMDHPGDRSRREDDRYLMLEALLAARDRLYISWSGRSVRDNSAQPPSVLVAQLRDYLQAGWQDLKLEQITIEHFLQPFSRHYFEQNGLSTFANEWRAAHDTMTPAEVATLPRYSPEPGAALTLAELGYFMRQPAKQFFKRRLQVEFADKALTGMDDEPFALDKLEHYQVTEQLLADEGPPEAENAVRERLQHRIARMEREGRLPIGELALRMADEWVEQLEPVRTAWLALNRRFPRSPDKVRVILPCEQHTVDDWIDQVRMDGDAAVWIQLNPGRLLDNKDGKLDKSGMRVHKLIDPYVRQLASSAAGRPLTGYLVARDCIVQCAPIAQAQAREQLEALVTLWGAGMDAPLPTACETALALLAKDAGAARTRYDGSDFNFGMHPEGKDACLARLWREYADLAAEPGHDDISRRLYEPLRDWVAGGTQLFPLNHVFAQTPNP
ncbi:exodeoxyribonuclease V subunit gamma [Massilia sp. NEAU-DD11]|uniref:RecBCD enzyme subunit RecC n=1 Tax=Massilia cellulosiltytica TaxID=2683234 RepID=A0A7X3KAL2_9BURK|nr:exodeoxyribonuclease V subunit gamma [Telluria cellulosilytica]MVW64189.1 exodeoxyribonuclease V subunit gamma [Telluria cellulosilytica]